MATATWDIHTITRLDAARARIVGTATVDGVEYPDIWAEGIWDRKAVAASVAKFCTALHARLEALVAGKTAEAAFVAEIAAAVKADLDARKVGA
ncbi:MAG TPA: hypothetical protein VMY35_02790 [Phycisphaerae bacterium]|nr:hypothetical protein [Phycisphaerae bacterium]